MNKLQIDAISEQLGWEWTKPQKEIIDNLTRFIQISGGNRGGKSDFSAKMATLYTMDALESVVTKDLRVSGGVIPIWLVAANYERTWQEFTYTTEHLKRLFGDKAVHATSRVDPGSITIDAGKFKLIIRTKSAADEQSLVMEAPAAVVICEAAQISHQAYIRLHGRVAERRAPMLMSGTLVSDLGWYVDQLNRWSSPAVWATEDSRSWVIPSHTNHFIFPLGENDPEILRLRATMTEDEFNREFMGVPSPPRGLVHPSFSTAVHVREVPFIPDELVWLAVDPGIAGPEAAGSAYAVECIQVPPTEMDGTLDSNGNRINAGQIRVFDEVYVDNMLEETIIEDVIKHKYWWGKAPVMGVIDRAGATRAGAHEASVEVWRKLAGVTMLYTERAIPIPDLIRRHDSFLKVNAVTGEPGFAIDVHCRGLTSEHGGCESPLRPGVQDQVYRWRTDRDGTIVGDRPRDRHNDAIKAAQYFEVNQFGYATASTTKRITKVKRYRKR